MQLFSAIKEGFNAFIVNLTKKEELVFPYEWALVRTNSVAKEKGINDDYNKEIVMIINNKEDKTYQYSEHLVKILREQGIPVEYEPEDTDEEIEFDEVTNFGETRLERS